MASEHAADEPDLRDPPLRLSVMDDSYSDPPNMSPRLARRIERTCCNFITYLPLVFVYGITSWAVWVIVTIV